MSGQQQRPGHGAVGEKDLLPFDLEARVPHEWLHQPLWLPGTTGISSVPQPLLFLPQPAGPRGFPIRPGLLQLCPEELDQTHPLGLELKLNQVAIPVWDQIPGSGSSLSQWTGRLLLSKHPGSLLAEWRCKWS